MSSSVSGNQTINDLVLNYQSKALGVDKKTLTAESYFNTISNIDVQNADKNLKINEQFKGTPDPEFTDIDSRGAEPLLDKLHQLCSDGGNLPHCMAPGTRDSEKEKKALNAFCKLPIDVRDKLIAQKNLGAFISNVTGESGKVSLYDCYKNVVPQDLQKKYAPLGKSNTPQKPAKNDASVDVPPVVAPGENSSSNVNLDADAIIEKFYAVYDVNPGDQNARDKLNNLLERKLDKPVKPFSDDGVSHAEDRLLQLIKPCIPSADEVALELEKRTGSSPGNKLNQGQIGEIIRTNLPTFPEKYLRKLCEDSDKFKEFLTRMCLFNFSEDVNRLDEDRTDENSFYYGAHEFPSRRSLLLGDEGETKVSTDAQTTISDIKTKDGGDNSSGTSKVSTNTQTDTPGITPKDDGDRGGNTDSKIASNSGDEINKPKNDGGDNTGPNISIKDNKIEIKDNKIEFHYHAAGSGAPETPKTETPSAKPAGKPVDSSGVNDIGEPQMEIVEKREPLVFTGNDVRISDLKKNPELMQTALTELKSALKDKEGMTTVENFAKLQEKFCPGASGKDAERIQRFLAASVLSIGAANIAKMSSQQLESTLQRIAIIASDPEAENNTHILQINSHPTKEQTSSQALYEGAFTGSDVSFSNSEQRELQRFFTVLDTAVNHLPSDKKMSICGTLHQDILNFYKQNQDSDNDDQTLEKILQNALQSALSEQIGRNREAQAEASTKAIMGSYFQEGIHGEVKAQSDNNQNTAPGTTEEQNNTDNLDTTIGIEEKGDTPLPPPPQATDNPAGGPGTGNPEQ